MDTHYIKGESHVCCQHLKEKVEQKGNKDWIRRIMGLLALSLTERNNNSIPFLFHVDFLCGSSVVLNQSIWLIHADDRVYVLLLFYTCLVLVIYVRNVWTSGKVYISRYSSMTCHWCTRRHVSSSLWLPTNATPTTLGKRASGSYTTAYTCDLTTAPRRTLASNTLIQLGWVSYNTYCEMTFNSWMSDDMF